MKRSIRWGAWLVAAAVLLCALVGCQASFSGGPSGAGSKDGSAASSLESGGDRSGDESSGGEIPLPEDFFTVNGQALLPTSAQVPAYVTAGEQAFLYRCPFSLPDHTEATLHQNDRMLALQYWQEGVGNCARLYDKQDGQMLWEGTLPVWCETGLLDSGELWCLEYTGVRVTAYGKDGTMRVLREGDGASGDGFSCGAVTSDGRYGFLLSASTREAVILDLSGGVRTSVELPDDYTYWTVLHQEGDTVWLTDYGRSVLLLHLADGTVERRQFSRWVGNAYGEIVQFTTERSSVCMQSLKEPDQQLFTTLPDPSENILDLAFGCMATYRYDSDANGNTVLEIRFYDLREGVLVSRVDLDTHGVFGAIDATWQRDGSVLLSLPDGFYWYDLPAAAAQPAGDKLEVICASDAELHARTDALAEQVYVNTGVELLYGSRGNDFICESYVGVAELDPYLVYCAVKEAAAALALYPDGMLREAYAETHSGLLIYLCGTLYGVGYGGLEQAGGVTTEYGDDIVVAVDMANGVKNTLHHELSHVFDRRIVEMGRRNGQDWVSLWRSLTPYADAYTEAYGNYASNGRYTAYFESNPDRVWFVSSYARTFDTEDRACLMEQMFQLADHPENVIFQYPHLVEKARAYSYILRQCFPSCAGADSLIWESGLGTIDNLVIPNLSAA